ncbi:MAG: CDP-alcohol phosphatidyltransferase family protein [Flavobacteriaceae bacterium]
MRLKKHIPNSLTLLNLLCGIIATMLAVINQLELAAYFVILGIVFDFFDGFVARLLKVQGELGKQLDSLADVVTSGIAPAVVMFQLLEKSLHNNWLKGLSCEVGEWSTFNETASLSLKGISVHPLPFLGLLLALAAAYRLANFNIDTRQTSSFIGLPTPAMSLFVMSLPLILIYSDAVFIKELILNKYVLIGITLFLSYLMNAELKLFSFKIKDFTFKKYSIHIVYLIIVILAFIFLKFIAIPLSIMLYIIFSVLLQLLKK